MIKNDWDALLKHAYNSSHFLELQDFLAKEYEGKQIYPKYSSIYRALELCSYAQTRIVILGQDPYHGEGQADGLSFSIGSKEAKYPPSLRNIFKELEADRGIIRTNKNLSDWAKQGILLLNTVLTVEKGKAFSHSNKGWEKFTDEIIKKLNEKEDPIIFLLWGNYAQKKAALITNEKHEILVGVHPSPLSAYRGFIGSKPFSKIDTIILNSNGKQIKW
ncbi:uracil-DNA-glycosylase [Erysipelotrichaceae bacterium]|nr:uracil-DNA-glycosylase [Erysipelotrichaceae bacterium]